MSEKNTDRLYQVLQTIRKRPQLYIGDRDITKLRVFTDGFLAACTHEQRAWNCLTGFNEFCSEWYQDNRSYDWSHFILEHEKDKDAIDVFYFLLDRYLEIRKEQGYPLTLPPHYSLGGLYKTDTEGSGKTLLWMPVYYYNGLYLAGFSVVEARERVEEMNEKRLQEKQFELAWVGLESLPFPEKSQLITRLPLRGDYCRFVPEVHKYDSYFDVCDDYIFVENTRPNRKAEMYSLKEITDAENINNEFGIKEIIPNGYFGLRLPTLYSYSILN